jgi:hypothetical protein
MAVVAVLARTPRADAGLQTLTCGSRRLLYGLRCRQLAIESGVALSWLRLGFFRPTAAIPHAQTAAKD